MNETLKQYYEYLKGAGADVPPSFESFQNTLSNPESAKKYYGYVKSSGYDAPDTFDSFAKTLGITSSIAEPTQQSSSGTAFAGLGNMQTSMQVGMGDEFKSKEELAPIENPGSPFGSMQTSSQLGLGQAFKDVRKPDIAPSSNPTLKKYDKIVDQKYSEYQKKKDELDAVIEKYPELGPEADVAIKVKSNELKKYEADLDQIVKERKFADDENYINFYDIADGGKVSVKKGEIESDLNRFMSESPVFQERGEFVGKTYEELSEDQKRVVDFEYASRYVPKSEIESYMRDNGLSKEGGLKGATKTVVQSAINGVSSFAEGAIIGLNGGLVYAPEDAINALVLKAQMGAITKKEYEDGLKLIKQDASQNVGATPLTQPLSPYPVANMMISAGEYNKSAGIENVKNFNMSFEEASAYDGAPLGGSQALIDAARFLKKRTRLFDQTVYQGEGVKTDIAKFATTTLPQGAGYIASIAATSAIFGPAVSGVLSSMSQAGSMYQDALNSGEVVTGTDLTMTHLAGLGLGATDYVPVGRMFNEFKFLDNVIASKSASRFLSGGLEEGFQEAFQTVGENFTAQQLYDSDRKVFDGVVEASLAGFMLGGFMDLGIGAVKSASENKKKEEIDAIKKIMDPKAELLGKIAEYAEENGTGFAVDMRTGEIIAAGEVDLQKIQEGGIEEHIPEEVLDTEQRNEPSVLDDLEDGSPVNYQGISGDLVKNDDGFYVQADDGQMVLIEGGMNPDASLEDIGVKPLPGLSLTAIRTATAKREANRNIDAVEYKGEKYYVSLDSSVDPDGMGDRVFKYNKDGSLTEVHYARGANVSKKLAIINTALEKVGLPRRVDSKPSVQERETEGKKAQMDATDARVENPMMIHEFEFEGKKHTAEVDPVTGEIGVVKNAAGREVKLYNQARMDNLYTTALNTFINKPNVIGQVSEDGERTVEPEKVKAAAKKAKETAEKKTSEPSEKKEPEKTPAEKHNAKHADDLKKLATLTDKKASAKKYESMYARVLKAEKDGVITEEQADEQRAQIEEASKKARKGRKRDEVQDDTVVVKALKQLKQEIADKGVDGVDVKPFQKIVNGALEVAIRLVNAGVNLKTAISESVEYMVGRGLSRDISQSVANKMREKIKDPMTGVYKPRDRKELEFTLREVFGLTYRESVAASRVIDAMGNGYVNAGMVDSKEEFYEYYMAGWRMGQRVSSSLNQKRINSGASSLSKEEVQSRIASLRESGYVGWEFVKSLLKDAYGDDVYVYHATDDSGAKSISDNGNKLSSVSVKNRKKFGSSYGFYVQIGESTYVSDERGRLFYSKVPMSYLLENSYVDTDSLMSKKELSGELGFELSGSSDALDFVNAVVSNGYSLDGIEFLFSNELSGGDVSVGVKEFNGSEESLKQNRVVSKALYAEVINGFYSPIEQKLHESKQPKFSAKKWMEIVGKKDEAIYTGVYDMLASRKPDEQIHRDEILQWMKDNRIEIREVVKGGVGNFSTRFGNLVASEIELKLQQIKNTDKADLTVEQNRKGTWNIYNRSVSPLPILKEIASKNEADDVINNTDKYLQSEPTRYSQYQLEGEKENYKEVLVILPNRTPLTFEEFKARAQKETSMDDYEVNEAYKNYIAKGDFSKLAPNQFKSRHYDELNILVHLRMNTRTDATGKKVLFLEEIQSDWGQTGKKIGFFGSNIFSAKQKSDGSWDVYQSGILLKNVFANNEKEAIKIAGYNPDFTGYPTAPFVMDTNAWTKLGLKVALKEAVAQGADKIAWTTGTQQFDRWGTEKIDWVKKPEFSQKRYDELRQKIKEDKASDLEVDEFQSLTKSKKGGWTVNIQEQFTGTAFEGMNVDEKALSEKGITINSKEDLKAAIDRTLSREITERQKLTDRIWDRMQKEDSGTSLPRKEGMESFYGTEGTKGIVGSVAEALFGVKIGEVEIETANVTPSEEEIEALLNDEVGEGMTREEAIEYLKNDMTQSRQPSIDITPEIIAEVQRGLPLFQARVQDAAQYHPGKKLIDALVDPDVSSPIHEFAHNFFDDLLKHIALGNDKAWAIYEEFLNFAGSEDGRKFWNDKNPSYKFGNEFDAYNYVFQQELFAHGLEQRLKDGVSYSGKLNQFFDVIRQFLQEIYDGVMAGNLNIKLSPAMVKMYDRVLGLDAEVPDNQFSEPSIFSTLGMRPLGQKRVAGDLLFDTYYEQFMTETADGKSYVFFHVSGADPKSIRKGIDSTKYHSTRTAKSEKGMQYGVASYYTGANDGESMVMGETYTVVVPKNKVYPMNTDPNGYQQKAEKKIKKGEPARWSKIEKEMAAMAKRDGYVMAVAEWGYDRTTGTSDALPALRADALVALKPEKGDVKYRSIDKEIYHPDREKMILEKRLNDYFSEVEMGAKYPNYPEGYQLALKHRVAGTIPTKEEFDIINRFAKGKKLKLEGEHLAGVLYGGVVGKYDALPGSPKAVVASGPIPDIVDAAEKYAEQFGIPYARQGEYVKVDEGFSKRIAEAYEKMKHDPQNPKVKEAYADLIRQTKNQYQALVDAGYEFTFFDSKTDPYKGNPMEAMRDLRNNKRMAVYGTYDGYGTDGITGANIEDNPMLEDTGLKWPDQDGVMRNVTANDLFRAVHDAFGHGLEGAGFRARGEENAWQAHVRLFTGPAVAAITSETRGQNSWLNFGPYGDKNRTAKLEDTVFAEQKIGLMPEWTWTENVAPPMQKATLKQTRFVDPFSSVEATTNALKNKKVVITQDNWRLYLEYVLAGGVLNGQDLIDLRNAVKDHFDRLKVPIDKEFEDTRDYKAWKAKNDEINKEYFKTSGNLSSIDNAFALKGDIDALETYHFTDSESVLSILEENNIWGEGVTMGVSTTTNAYFDHPELTQVQWYGEGNKPITFADKGVRIDLNLPKIKEAGFRVKKGSEGIGTFEGEEELRIGDYDGLKSASDYINKIQVDRRVVDDSAFNEIKDKAESLGIPVVEKTDYEKPVRTIQKAEDTAKKYHEAKRNGSNPDLVSAVENLIGEERGPLKQSRVKNEIASIVSESKKNGTYLKAPNGKKTNLSPSQWAMVRTKNFKNWFGDWENDPENASKIVDENGEPRVMYHGTFVDIGNDIFSGERGSAGHFAFKESFASKWADVRAKEVEDDLKFYGGFGVELPAKNIVPVFLNVRRVFDFAKQHDELFLERDEKSPWQILEEGSHVIYEMGYDGYYDYEERIVGVGRPSGVAVRSPFNIKSAVGNSGDFDPGQPFTLKQARIKRPDSLYGLNQSEWGAIIREVAKNLKGIVGPSNAEIAKAVDDAIAALNPPATDIDGLKDTLKKNLQNEELVAKSTFVDLRNRVNDMLAGARDKKAEIDNVRKELEEWVKQNRAFINSGKVNLTAAVIRKINNAKTEAKVLEAINYINDLIADANYKREQQQRAEKVAKIFDLLNPEKYKTKENALVKGKKIDPETIDFVTKAFDMLTQDRFNAMSEMHRLMDERLNGRLDSSGNLVPLTPDEDAEARERISLLYFAGVDDADAFEVDQILEAAEDLIDNGKQLLAAIKAQNAAEYNAAKEKLMRDLAGKRGTKADLSSPESTTEKPGMIKSLVTAEGYDLVSLLDTFSHSSKEKNQESFAAERYGKGYARAESAARADVFRLNSIISQKQKELLGKGMSKFRFYRLLERNSKKRIAVTYVNSIGETQTVNLTMNQMAYAWGLWRNVESRPNIKFKMEIANPATGVTEIKSIPAGQDFYDQIDAIIPQEMKDYTIWMMDEYLPKLYPEVNKVYTKVYGVKLGRHKYYLPTKVVSEARHDTGSYDIFEAFSMAGVASGNVRMRISHNQELAHLDINDAVIQYTLGVTKFVHYAELYKEMRRMFYDKDILRQLQSYNNREKVSLLHSYISAVSDQRAANNFYRIFDTMRRNVSFAALAAKLPLALYQIFNSLMYLTQLPTSYWHKFLFSFVSGQPFWTAERRAMMKRMANSNYFVQRRNYGSSWEIMEQIINGRGNKMSIWKKVLMSATLYGDQAAILYGGLPVYEYHYKKAKSNGYSDDMAHKIAEDKWAQATDATQQSGLTARSGISDVTGTWTKWFTMFATQPRQINRLIFSNYQNMRDGRISKGEFAKMFFIAHVVMPSIIQLIANGFDWDDEDQLRAAIVGNLNSFVILGNVIEAAANITMGEKVYGTGSPVTDYVDATVKYGQSFANDVKDGDDEMIMSGIKLILHGTGLFTPFPSGQVSNVIKAVEEDSPKKTARIMGWSARIEKTDSEVKKAIQADKTKEVLEIQSRGEDPSEYYWDEEDQSMRKLEDRDAIEAWKVVKKKDEKARQSEYSWDGVSWVKNQ